MNVPTIHMTSEKAQEKLEAYKSQLHRRADSEYEAAVQGYQALATGKILLDLQEVFRNIPYDEKDRPMLAIARADRRQVQFGWNDKRLLVFDCSSMWSRPPRNSTLVIQIDAGRRWLGPQGASYPAGGYALVPMVPADVRPNVQLRNCHVLWEVPGWADSRISSKPPSDPYLLQHLAGSLYVVLAEWELTDLERAITRGRAE